MFRIDRSNNECHKIQKVSFSELGFREREHLQEWFVKNPSMFGEDLLIIQKEFDGFNDTRERLDLLALDQSGNLVIIENKLDDSGKNVTWQSLKYASYCSSLTKDNIKSIYQEYLLKNGISESAEKKISDFIGLDYDEIILNQGSSQRVILVAANFRKEVTSTVIWLTNYNLNIKCIKVTPYRHEDSLFLDVNQIIPVKDIEEYTIRMMDKQADEKNIYAKNQTRHSIRYEFWTILLDQMKKETDLFSRISPKKDNWICAGTGVSGVIYSFVIAKDASRVELYIATGNKLENERIYDYFYSQKDLIEKDLDSNNIQWLKLEAKNASRISIPICGNYFDEEDWKDMIPNMVSAMLRLYKVMNPYISMYKKSR